MNMGTKCPVCGAPMENDICGYCGYAEKKETEKKETAKADDTANYAAQQAPMMQPRMNMQPQMPMQPQTAFGAPPYMNAGITPGISRKSKTVALLLCIFLGGAGAHKFYVGKVGMGIVYLCTFGLAGIGWFIDFILILSGNFQDEFGLPLRQ